MKHLPRWAERLITWPAMACIIWLASSAGYDRGQREAEAHADTTAAHRDSIYQSTLTDLRHQLWVAQVERDNARRHQPSTVCTEIPPGTVVLQDTD